MQLTIEKLVYGGDGLARTSDGVVFVPHTAPGDVVEVEILSKKKDFARARLREVLTPSPDRQEPACPNYKTVGCCHWEHIRYDRQLDYKEAIVRESLSRLAKIEFAGTIERISGPAHAYRHRATFHLRNGALGFVRENTNVIVPIRECAALVPELNTFIPTASAERIPAVTVDAIAADGVVAATFRFPDGHSKNRFYGRSIGDAKPVLSAGGVQYALNSDAFFQANRYLLDPFVREVMRQLDADSSCDVLDLYAGSGFFALPIAKVARQVLGVESERAAVKQAVENANLNGVENAEFVVGSVDTMLSGAEVKPQRVLLNPPRTGAGPQVAALVAELNSPRIVYVSCNPATFAREAAVFVKAGYALSQLTMIDQFPNTYHIELVARFER